MRDFAQRTASWLSVSVALVCCACTAKISGTVEDPFGKPLKEVAVTIENSDFRAATDERGRYEIPYAAGTFRVKYSAPGYTTAVLPLSLNERSDYPASKVILFPRPAHPGMYLFRDAGLEAITRVEVEEHKTESSFTTRLRYFTKGMGKWAAVKPGEVSFADTESREITLVKLAPDGLIYDVSFSFMVPSTNFDRGVSAEKVEVGEEKLVIRKARLTPGDYAWVVMGQQGLTPLAAPGKTCYPFHVNSAGQPVSDDDRLRRTVVALEILNGAIGSFEQEHAGQRPLSMHILKLGDILSPKFVKLLPLRDGWGNFFDYTMGPYVTTFASAGTDGRIDNSQVMYWMDDPFTKEKKVTEGTGGHIIFTNSSLVQYPSAVDRVMRGGYSVNPENWESQLYK